MLSNPAAYLHRLSRVARCYVELAALSGRLSSSIEEDCLEIFQWVCACALAPFPALDTSLDLPILGYCGLPEVVGKKKKKKKKGV
jgi:hypothetical protein